MSERCPACDSPVRAGLLGVCEEGEPHPWHLTKAHGGEVSNTKRHYQKRVETLKARAEAAEARATEIYGRARRAEATLAAVRERYRRWDDSWSGGREGEDAQDTLNDIRLLLDREGEK